ncbi:hypothetical protein EVA_13734, partial [gut metagenome]
MFKIMFVLPFYINHNSESAHKKDKNF